MSNKFSIYDQMIGDHEKFRKECEYLQASIRMKNPEFFGVTKEEAKRYKAILEERESELYHPEDEEDDNVVADVEYRESGISDIVEEWNRHEEEMRQEILAIEDWNHQQQVEDERYINEMTLYNS